MTKNIKVVIGANYGDEGKGLMTDYFASNDSNSLVVRFNGGSQAGHTVVTPNGKEHVFSHFGSGVLNGVSSYLSRFFLVNPIMYVKEHQDLSTFVLGLPDLYIDPQALVTTPYDMIINQAAEMSRGDSRHGSCGLGISETVLRSEHDEYRLTVNDLTSDGLTLRTKLLLIREEYLPLRLRELGLDTLPDVLESAVTSDDIIDSFMDDCAYLVNTAVVYDYTVMNTYDTIVFEGAQGLLLDQDLEEFSPHITHSSTGLTNVLEILKDVSFDYSMEVVYVTRAYLTRHGEGPLAHELPAPPYRKVIDTTNVPNEWQGTLRFALLDLNFLRRYIFLDMNKGLKSRVTLSLAVTCLDQIDDKALFIVGGKEVEDTIGAFIGTIQSMFYGLGFSNFYRSWGRTRDDVKLR